jgi:hypothetical protein
LSIRYIFRKLLPLSSFNTENWIGALLHIPGWLYNS